MKKSLYLFVTVLAISACSKKNNGGSSSSASSNIVLLLTAQSSGLRTQSTNTSCEVRDNDASGAPTSDESGYCLTPDNMLGSIFGMHLGSTATGANVRLLGGGDSVHGLDAIFDFHKFSLLDPETFAGDDTIQEASGSSFNNASLSYYHLESVFQAAGDTWHVRYFFTNSQPSVASPFSSCSVGSDELGRLDEKAGTLFSGIAFRKYDIMACVEATGVDCTEDSQFGWVDKDDADYALVTTRPTHPLQLVNASGGEPSTIFGADDECTSGGDHPNYSLADVSVEFDLTSQISGLSAEISAGKKNYTYAGTTGNKLTATIAFVLDDFLFYPSSTGLGNDLQVSTLDSYKKLVRQNLNKILPKGLYVKTRRASRDTTYAFQHDASVSLAVTTE